MTRPVFERVAVVGLGLMGGSAALAALERGAAGQVRGVDPALADGRRDPAGAARRGGRLGRPAGSGRPSRGDGRRRSARRRRTCGPSTLLTDLASVKAPVAELARRHLPWPENCVGAHPMAGSDRTGFAAADPALFAGAPCILALSGGETAEVVDRIEEFWQCLGSRTVRMSPGGARHDRGHSLACAASDRVCLRSRAAAGRESWSWQVRACVISSASHAPTPSSGARFCS